MTVEIELLSEEKLAVLSRFGIKPTFTPELLPWNLLGATYLGDSYSSPSSSGSGLL
jgi:hypothetical protein